METVDQKFIDSVLEKYDNDKARIIAIMQDVQEQYRYLPQEALEYIAKKVGMSESKLYGVATFYGNFSLDAKGKYVLKVCRMSARAARCCRHSMMPQEQMNTNPPRTTACSPWRSSPASVPAG